MRTTKNPPKASRASQGNPQPASPAQADFSKPQPISDVDLAFPASVRHLMPPYDRCVAERVDRKWERLFSDWFYRGLKSITVTCKPGIDEREAKRHLRAIMGSFEPKHEHKSAACALLMSLWFEDAEWETNSPHDFMGG